MIKALLSTDHDQIVLLGLSCENMARLMADEPIVLDLADLGLPTQRIVIVGGKDEDTIAARVRAGAAR